MQIISSCLIRLIFIYTRACAHTRTHTHTHTHTHIYIYKNVEIASLVFELLCCITYIYFKCTINKFSQQDLIAF